MDLVEKAQDSDTIIARAEAVIWFGTLQEILSSKGRSVENVLCEGNEVLLRVKPDFHERYGLKFLVDDVDTEYTLGKMALKRAETLEQLRKKGILHKNKGIQPPIVFQRIAVVSSATAAGLQDFTRQLQGNPYGYSFTVNLFESTVQGDAAAGRMADILRGMTGNYDAVALIRGGGARLDLSAFDEYVLGEAIAMCRIPVLTGVGHDIDETVADHVAHSALKTPTAVADYLIEHNLRFESLLLRGGRQIAERAQLLSKFKENELNDLKLRIGFQAGKSVPKETLRLAEFSGKIRTGWSNTLLNNRVELERLSVKISETDPRAILAKGYAMITKDGKPEFSSKELNPGDAVEIIMQDGKLSAEIKSKTNP